MTYLRKISSAVVLTLVLAIVGAATCPPPAPGQTETMPCGFQQATDDSTAPGQTSTPPAADTVDVISAVEVALIELLILW